MCFCFFEGTLLTLTHSHCPVLRGPSRRRASQSGWHPPAGSTFHLAPKAYGLTQLAPPHWGGKRNLWCFSLPTNPQFQAPCLVQWARSFQPEQNAKQSSSKHDRNTPRPRNSFERKTPSKYSHSPSRNPISHSPQFPGSRLGSAQARRTRTAAAPGFCGLQSSPTSEHGCETEPL